jgi:vacuolar-type H+-ATPase catalytic subunit A/Vma1
VEKLAVEVKADRRPAASNNPFLQMQKQISDQIIIALDAYRDTRDRIEEEIFFAVYGSPVVQGMLGFNSGEKVRGLPGVSPEMRAAKKARAAAYVAKVRTGGFVEALVRAVLYVISADRALDERCASALHAARHDLSHLSLEQYKALVRDQFSMLLLERERAIKAIATMVSEFDQRTILLKRVIAIIGADSMSTAVVRERITHLEKLLATQITNSVPPRAPVRRGVRSEMSAAMVPH